MEFSSPGYWGGLPFPSPGDLPNPGIELKSPTLWASRVAQLVRNLPAMQETWVQFLGWEDTLEKEMATHSSILAWRIPWTEEPGRLQSMGSQELDTTYQLNTSTISYIAGRFFTASENENIKSKLVSSHPLS